MDYRKPDISDEHHVPVTGDWHPQDKRQHMDYIKQINTHVEEHPKELHPVLAEFRDLVEHDTRLFLLSSAMFDDVPYNGIYKNDPVGDKQIRDFPHLISLLNHIITTGPTWSDRAHKVGAVGTPVTVALVWPMGTHAGFAFFLDPQVNAALKKVLNVWGEFLSSKDSAYVLEGQHSWLGEHGIQTLTDVANRGQTNLKFEEIFQCDPSAKCYGYDSWDSFFTRKIHDSARPIASPDDDSVIANVCESKPYACKGDVKARDKFWIKGVTYSVNDMLAHDSLAGEFVGGTVYQAFLSALSYHRWHSPVNGKVVKALIKEGTYYSEPLYEDFSQSQGAEPQSETVSQNYLSCVATRGIIFIQADNPAIGLMAVILVGMTEVSTIDVRVKEGQHLKKGDLLGMFHFGGSTHCLIFRKGVKVSGFPEIGMKDNVPVRSQIAVVE